MKSNQQFALLRSISMARKNVLEVGECLVAASAASPQSCGCNSLEMRATSPPDSLALLPKRKKWSTFLTGLFFPLQLFYFIWLPTFLTSEEDFLKSCFFKKFFWFFFEWNRSKALGTACAYTRPVLERLKVAHNDREKSARTSNEFYLIKWMNILF